MKDGDIVKVIPTGQYGIIHAINERNPRCLVNVYLFDEDIYKAISVFDLEFVSDSSECNDDSIDDSEPPKNEE